VRLAIDVERIKGTPVSHVIEAVLTLGADWRIIEEDGVSRMRTNDSRSDRLNLHTVDGRVTEAYVG